MGNPLRCVLLAVVLLCATVLATTPDTLREFRDIFASHSLRRNSSLTDTDIHGWAMLPPQELVQAEGLSDFDSVVEAYKGVRLSDCKKLGDAEPFTLVDPISPLLLRTKTGKRPVTIFIFGHFGAEVFSRFAFDTLYNTSSIFAKEYSSALAQHPTNATVWDNNEYADIEMPLNDIVKTASVDTQNGTALYQIVWFLQHEGSLESFAHYSKVVPRLTQRITKLMSLIGDKIDDFVILGFSRGAIDALEIISNRNSMPWGAKYKGVITLEGVVYGTTLGDCALGKLDTAACRSFTTLIGILKNLSTDLVPKATHFLRNLIVLNKAIIDFDTAVLSFPFPQKLLETDLVWPNLWRTWTELIKNFLFSMWDITSLVTDYDTNVRRTMLLSQSVVESFEMFQTQTRLDWWRNHTIPADALYLSGSASMFDSNYTYPKLYPDGYGMRFFYYMLNDATGEELIDGAVPASRQRILPEVHRNLNPSQPAYTAQWVSMFMGTHSSMAVEYVVPAGKDWSDPFPRPALLDSIATWIAINLN